MFRDNPAKTLVIGWSQPLVSLQNGSNFKLYYSSTDHGTDTTLYALDNQPVIPSRTSQMKSLNHYFVRLANLSPNTNYYFTIAYDDVSGQRAQTPRYYSATLPDVPTEPLSIIAGGDSRLDLEHPDQTAESIIIRQEANKMVSKLRPHLVAFGGDYTFANADEEWVDWLEDWELTYSSDGRITPIVAAIGNHEYPPFLAPSGAQVVVDIFDVPSPDVYYALTFGGNLLRLYTLNTEISIPGNQSQWLEQDLQTTGFDVYWKMAQYHKPIRPHEADKSDNNDGFHYWAQPFWDYQVRLVVESDAHVVKTTWPVMPTTQPDGTGFGNYQADHNFVRNENRGTVFVGEGTWAALRSGNDPKAWTRDMGGFNQVKWIWVNRDSIQVRTVVTYDPTDSLYVKNLQELSDTNRFSEPTGIQLWNPGNGKVVSITDNGRTPRPSLSSDQPNYLTYSAEFSVDPSLIKDGFARVRLNYTREREGLVRIFNLQGQELINQTIYTSGDLMQGTFDFNGMPEGIYLITLKAGDQIYTKRVIFTGNNQ